ncbi:MAG: SDR family oxidoreductase [Rhodospirillaceae bacterium]|nr:SDR family oxidoreductase [Rhodospirillaceae bacterium]MBT5245561.1 SDR family oxidoreductase [Rhodospirillaceae bacterium]MBT5561043.1 SDR family oxidoreductase [Rhodospirillaceae bacterium]MBT6240679.1 SDR family oxidoreductase [Rhodospirillaceae bacterium]
MRSLVTGGAGFIGSHLVTTLLDLGHDVCVLDNFSTGRPQNLDHVKDNPHLQIHQVDIGSGADMGAFFDGVERVYHLAALADIVPSIEQPEAYHRANVDGTFHVLQAANRAAVKRFVYIASSSCYGLPDINPTPEDADIRPMYPYALTKYVGETYAMHWAQLYGLPAVSLRLFNVYGPRSRTSGTYGAVFGVFLAQKLAGKPYTVVGDGTQTRDFTFVSDIVSAILAAADSDLSGKIMNVGSGDTYSVNRLVELLGGEVTYIPKRPGEPDCTFADTQKIRKLLNWQPKVSFEDGVKEMLDNIDYWREAPVWEPASIAEATTGWFKYLAGNDG